MAVELAAANAGADRAPTAQWRLAYAEALLAAGDGLAAGDQLALAEPALRAELAPGSDELRRLEAARRALPATR